MDSDPRGFIRVWSHNAFEPESTIEILTKVSEHNYKVAVIRSKA